MTEGTSGLNVWNRRDLGVELSATQVIGSVSDGDLEYICDHIYPFIQLIDSNAVFGEGQRKHLNSLEITQ